MLPRQRVPAWRSDKASGLFHRTRNASTGVVATGPDRSGLLPCVPRGAPEAVRPPKHLALLPLRPIRPVLLRLQAKYNVKNSASWPDAPFPWTPQDQAPALRRFG